MVSNTNIDPHSQIKLMAKSIGLEIYDILFSKDEIAAYKGMGLKNALFATLINRISSFFEEYKKEFNPIDKDNAAWIVFRLQNTKNNFYKEIEILCKEKHK